MKKKLARSFSGFSLTELMIVVVIISILAAIALPMYSRYIRKSRTSEAISNLGAIAMYEETYYSEQDRYQYAGPSPSTVPSKADPRQRLAFQTGVTGWSQLGRVIPDGTMVFFQYEVLAGQYPSGSSPSPIISPGYLVDITSATAGGTAYGCLNNTAITAQSLNILTGASVNWFFAVAVGDQGGNKTCSLFIKVIDRPDLVVENEID